MKPSGIITVTTDFGIRDPYVAMMKGVILSVNPEACIVDVTHDIPPGSIIQAANTIEEIIPFFPDGTVHVAVVDPGVGGQRLPLAVETENCYFVGPDNGIFSPVIERQKAVKIIHLTKRKFFLSPISNTFHGRDIFAPVAAYISIGCSIAQMGIDVNNLVSLPIPRPIMKAGILRGQVIRVDNFGNLITNIHQFDMEKFLGSASPRITICNVIIHEIRRIYTDVKRGESLALYGSSGYLEIAVHAGKASELPEFSPNTIIGIEVIVERKVV